MSAPPSRPVIPVKSPPARGFVVSAEITQAIAGLASVRADAAYQKSRHEARGKKHKDEEGRPMDEERWNARLEKNRQAVRDAQIKHETDIARRVTEIANANGFVTLINGKKEHFRVPIESQTDLDELLGHFIGRSKQAAGNEAKYYTSLNRMADIVSRKPGRLSDLDLANLHDMNKDTAEAERATGVPEDRVREAQHARELQALAGKDRAMWRRDDEMRKALLEKWIKELQEKRDSATPRKTSALSAAGGDLALAQETGDAGRTMPMAMARAVLATQTSMPEASGSPASLPARLRSIERVPA